MRGGRTQVWLAAVAALVLVACQPHASVASGLVEATTTSSYGLPDGASRSDCLAMFRGVCTPHISFSNEEPDGRGAVFSEAFPDPTALMQEVTCTVCSILYPHPNEVPRYRRHREVRVVLTDFDGVATASANEIRVSLRHLEAFRGASLGQRRTEFRGVLLHEAVHLYQSEGEAPGGLIEGLADFVRIRANLYEPGRRMLGGHWDDPYTTSGFFLSWLAGPCAYHTDGRVPADAAIGWAVNRQIGIGWSEQIWQDRFGTDVQTLWSEYQKAIATVAVCASAREGCLHPQSR